METLGNKVQEENSFIGNKEINDYLIQSSKWGKFLAILGYIGVAILIIAGIASIIGAARVRNFSLSEFFPMGFLGLVFIIIAILYYLGVNFLYQFSVQIKRGIGSSDVSIITSGFKYLKSFFKFMGLSAIIFISIYGIFLLVTLFQYTVK